jgi:hypothetical protein
MVYVFWKMLIVTGKVMQEFYGVMKTRKAVIQKIFSLPLFLRRSIPG